jgi:hypothetical protein
MPVHIPLHDRGIALRVFLCFASAYLLSYAFRSVNAVIAPMLVADVDLSNADPGLLSSAYFVTFALNPGCKRDVPRCCDEICSMHTDTESLGAASRAMVLSFTVKSTGASC